MNQRHVLLVEDDPSVSHIIATALKAEGVIVQSCASVAERDALISTVQFDLMITDVGLGDADGISTLAAVKEHDPQLPVIVISAQNTLNTAVRANETGAYEYFPKPFDLDELVDAAEQAMRPQNVEPQSAEVDDDNLPLVGRSPAMQEVYRMIARLLRNDLSVLILGESGTGKELVAEAIHNLGHRKSGPFVAVNMAAIPADLIEAELFGHEKGAFTGAINSAVGKFEQAQGGTVFLDEIGDMPMHAQTRLLRALQSGEINRVGGKEAIKLDVRIIAATNQDFPKLIEQGKFREDLYYRINVVPIDLPPLRDRVSDIPALAKHFLTMAVSEGLPQKRFSNEGLKLLQYYGWRGNVRELKNIIYRLVVTAREDELSETAINQILEIDQPGGERGKANYRFGDQVKEIVAQLYLDQSNEGSIYAHALERFERPLLEDILARAGGNQIKAAKLLGINRNTLRKKLTEYGIDPTLLR